MTEDLPPLPRSPPPLPSPTIPLTRDSYRMHELQRDGYSNSGQLFDDWYKIEANEDDENGLTVQLEYERMKGSTRI
ncbi:16964_t:CDS:2 [Racocetra fulgida]|uniref:16964_t:CDS:1 n=1 Tax=Racocetra fulgida TaxID=60492 RepID=A0A9N9FRC3_9GLOM|nr:16964_t:CDS:2 [Racocetra fulgida]